MPHCLSSKSHVKSPGYQERDQIKETDNPFGIVGGPVEGLIKVEDLDVVFNLETLEYLTDLAEIPSGEFVVEFKPVDRRLWFRTRVKYQVKLFLEGAQAPMARSIGEEMYHLERTIEFALLNGTPRSFTAVVTCLGRMSPEALAELSGHGSYDLPNVEELRTGDDDALNWLYGLVPTRLDSESHRADSVYTVTGSRELKKEGPAGFG